MSSNETQQQHNQYNETQQHDKTQHYDSLTSSSSRGVSTAQRESAHAAHALLELNPCE